MKYFCFLIALAAALIALPSSGFAHALLLESTPAANATLSDSNLILRLRFNSRIDHARSKLTLHSPEGKEQTLAPQFDAPPDELKATAQSLMPGVWRLRWQVLSVDGHITRGDIPFTIR